MNQAKLLSLSLIAIFAASCSDDDEPEVVYQTITETETVVETVVETVTVEAEDFIIMKILLKTLPLIMTKYGH